MVIKFKVNLANTSEILCGKVFLGAYGQNKARPWELKYYRLNRVVRLRMSIFLEGIPWFILWESRTGGEGQGRGGQFCTTDYI